MKSAFKFYITVLLIAFLAVGLTWFYMTKKMFNSLSSENTTLVLEKMRTVTKLIAVEGNFSQLYHHKTFYDYDFFNLFQKKIILRVTAKVSVGYDFEHINMTLDSLSKTVTLNEWPKPEILSIDHDLDYFDIQEGAFTSFSPQEYTQISKNAKKIIEDKALTTSLFNKAEEQKKNYIDMLDMALKSAGWKLIINDKLGVNH